MRTRAATPDDAPALERVFRSTRRDELAAIGWPDSAIESFCAQQYAMQQAHYSGAYPSAECTVVLDDACDVVGQITLDRGATSIVIVDLALLAEHRGNGIGTALLDAVLADADRLGVAVELTVRTDNRARSLYERLGFEVVDRTDLDVRMCRPSR